MNELAWWNHFDFGTRCFWIVLGIGVAVYWAVELLAADLNARRDPQGLMDWEPSQPVYTPNQSVRVFLAVAGLLTIPYIQVVILAILVCGLMMVGVAWWQARKEKPEDPS